MRKLKVPLNCLMGAVILMVYFRTFRIKALLRRGRLPHFYVINNKGEKWHFKREKDFLPAPYNSLAFIGNFVKIEKKLRGER